MSRKSREWKDIIRRWRAKGYFLAHYSKPTLASYRQGKRYWQRVKKDVNRDFSNVKSKVKQMKIKREEEEENE